MDFRCYGNLSKPQGRSNISTAETALQAVSYCDISLRYTNFGVEHSSKMRISTMRSILEDLGLSKGIRKLKETSVEKRVLKFKKPLSNLQICCFVRKIAIVRPASAKRQSIFDGDISRINSKTKILK